MRWIGVAALLTAALLAGQAMADPPPPPSSDTSVDPHIWRMAESGDARHVQSGLACPLEFLGYSRHDLHVYDGKGFDVSCDYARSGADATVYLTRFQPTVPIDKLFADAEGSFLRIRASANPQLRREFHPTDGGLTWDAAIYDDDHGMSDMIWIGDLDGWMLEYRLTYRTADEDQAFADLAAWTDAVKASAGAQLGGI
jgi:hypothetical protein